MSQEKLDNLTDALVENILTASDEDILAEATMGEIARAAWMAAPYPDDYWGATADAILEEVAKRMEDLDCNANDPSDFVRSLKSTNPGK